MDIWMSPCTGGKRARSPVDKLADLQQGGQGDDDEANWRSSKRYFTEVIANGFSKLTFSRGMQPQDAVQRSTQYQHDGIPGTYSVQVPAGLLSPRDDSDCEMEMQESPTWPPQRSSPCSNGIRALRAHSSTFNGLTSPPGACSMSAGQFPFGGYSAPASQAPQHAGALSAPHPAAGSPILPPKVLQAVEKAPNSPSDMPAVAGNLRKVALLRALLVRTEHHLQPQQPPEQPADTTTLDVQQQQQPQCQQGQRCGLNAPMLPQQQQQQQVQPHDGHVAGMCLSRGRVQDYPRPESMCACRADEQQGTCSSDLNEMECSSGNDSPGSITCSAAMPLQVALEEAASSLLCTEVLPGNSQDLHTINRQQQQQQQHCAANEADQQPASGLEPSPWLVNPMHDHAQQPYKQHHEAPLQRLQTQQQQRQQQSQLPLPQQNPSQMLPPQPKLRLPELSQDRLEALRAKAIASTSKLTDLEPEDLHSLQISLNASQCRRGSDRMHMNSTLAPAAACIRRHSSHI